MVTSKVGMSKSKELYHNPHIPSNVFDTTTAESADPEFDDYQRKFSALEDTVEKTLKDCKKFIEAVTSSFFILDCLSC